MAPREKAKSIKICKDQSIKLKKRVEWAKDVAENLRYLFGNGYPIVVFFIGLLGV